MCTHFVRRVLLRRRQMLQFQRDFEIESSFPCQLFAFRFLADAPKQPRKFIISKWIIIPFFLLLTLNKLFETNAAENVFSLYLWVIVREVAISRGREKKSADDSHWRHLANDCKSRLSQYHGIVITHWNNLIP